MKVRYSRPALAELDAILAQIAEKNPAAAERFRDRVEDVAARIGHHPRAFQEVPERSSVRSRSVDALSILDVLQNFPG
jgi:plasmid stabilization system protein ParE